MPGLLDDLNSLFSGSGISGQISVQVEGLNDITAAVEALTQGPDVLTNLRNAVGNLPVPAGLEGIGNLSSSLGSLSVPTDMSGALAPILGPITGLNIQVTGSVGAAIAALDLVREIVKLVTGQTAGGPNPMPSPAAFRMQDAPSIDQLRGLFVQANEFLDQAGPRLDAARLLQLLQSNAGAWRSRNFIVPVVPVIDDTMEALATIALWQTMNGAQLSAHLAHTLSRTAELIATPRTIAAKPVLDAGAAVAAGSGVMTTITRDTGPVITRLRTKITATGEQPSSNEVVAVEQAAENLRKLAEAMDPQRSPLARWSTADETITRQLLAVIRALEPSLSPGAVLPTLRDGLAALTPPPATAADEIVAEIEAFDLSALTDPLQAVTRAVQDVVDQVNEAKETVRQALEDALSPVADALDAALNAAGFEQIRTTLESLPNEIQNFVDTQITPTVEPIRSAVTSAVTAVSEAADQFDPEVLIQPLREAVESAAALLQGDEIAQIFADLENVLNQAISAIEGLEISVAADESIDLIGEIEAKVSAIDPATIPDSAKPLLAQGVQIVTNIEFSAEVGAPLLSKLEEALEAGPVAVIGELEAAMDTLKTALENFRPSVAIGDLLDRPFQDLLAVLRQFRPSDLLGLLQSALDDLKNRLHVLDVEAVVDPLVNVYNIVRTQVEALRPSTLLRPVEDAIQAAIERVYQASGVDTIFAGINDVLETIQSWTGLLVDCQNVLNRFAALLDQPGDASASVNAVVEDALARLDTVDMATLRNAFDQAATAAASIERDTLARDVAMAFQNAGRSGPALLNSADCAAVLRLGTEFPLAALRSQRETPSRDRVAAAIESWQDSAAKLAGARTAWTTLGPELDVAASRVQERMLDYYRVTRIEADNYFAEFLNPPRTNAELKEAVRRALTEALTDPLTTVLVAFTTLAPWVRLGGLTIGRVTGSIHAKIDSIVGAGGVGGAVNAIEDAVNLLRGIDLQPVVQPLDALYARVETAVAALNPEPLRAALRAARDAIAGLLNITTLINQSDIDALDATYNEALEKIEALSPGALVAETVDPVYLDLLADFLVVLDLPLRLRLRIQEAGRNLKDEAVRELARVEAAFDQMLRAIPLDGGASASVSVGVSASVG